MKVSCKRTSNDTLFAGKRQLTAAHYCWTSRPNQLYPPFSLWVSEWLLFNANSAIVQLYHDENKLIVNEMRMSSRSTLFYTNTPSWICIVLAHWNNSPRVDMSLHSDTLFWLRANQYLLFLLNDACLAEKQHLPIF
jgi:hypothetical protein